MSSTVYFRESAHRADAYSATNPRVERRSLPKVRDDFTTDIVVTWCWRRQWSVIQSRKVTEPLNRCLFGWRWELWEILGLCAHCLRLELSRLCANRRGGEEAQESNEEVSYRVKIMVFLHGVCVCTSDNIVATPFPSSQVTPTIHWSKLHRPLEP